MPLFCSLLLTLWVASQAAAAPLYPLKKSANGRYLLDSNNTPVLIVGDAPHSILANIGTNGWQTYFQNRGSNGVNNVWIELLCNDYTFGYQTEPGANYGRDFYGNNPFTATLSGGYYDLTTPNPAYWSNVDYVVAQAATNSVQCFLTPLDEGGWTQTSLANGTNRCYAYGQFLGNRYKNSPNIIWNLGNDFQNWAIPTNNSMILAIADGIKSVDSNHLLTVQLNYFVSQSMDDTNWAKRISINGVYNYFSTYHESQLAYNTTNLPVLFLEAHYEDEDVAGALGTPNVLRRQEYWSLLSGCLAGHMYGSYWIDRFDPAWQSHLNSTGMVQLIYFNKFFTGRAWYNLVPDTNHVFVTAGYGTYNGFLQPGDSDYATAAKTADGTLGIVYTPVSHTLTVALSVFTNNVTARWFDPTANTFTAIIGSPFANTGTHDFATPGNNAAGDGDWVLVLEAQPAGAQLVVTPTTLNFSFVATGTTASASFTVTNAGALSLSGTASVVNAGGTFTITGGSPFNVPVNGKTNVVVSFAPTSANVFSNIVAFASNGGISSNVVTGTGAIVPVANFSANPTNGLAPLSVTFTDTSTGTITNRFWNFGDTQTTNTTAVSVAHTYSVAGTNTVTLIVSGPVGVSTNIKAALVTVVVYPPGDVNGTFTVTTGDSLLLNQVAAGLRLTNSAVFSGAGYANGDVNGDGVVNTIDAALINEEAAGLRSYIVTKILPGVRTNTVPTAVTIYGIGFPTNTVTGATIGPPVNLSLSNVVAISAEQTKALVPAGGGLGTGTVNVTATPSNGVTSFGKFINQ